MKSATTLCPPAPALAPAAPALARHRVFDFLELTKPKVAVLVLFTVGIGAILADRGLPAPLAVIHTVIGTALVAAGASAFNQLIERRLDARMRRTENRPLPSGRILPIEAFFLGGILAISGVGYLALTLHQPWTALIAGVTFLLYVFIYTPLKQHTPWNTFIGAIPGALPPVIGWSAAGKPISWDILFLFALVFLWQMPHFFAIAWLYRHDYARAGYRMISTVDRRGRRTAREMVGYCVVLVAVSLTPWLMGRTGLLFGVGAFLLGGYFLAGAVRFSRQISEANARRVLKASLVYLPAVLGLFVLDMYLRNG